ncbi:hypothetical protein T265_02729 [Opisthorchis viverrini]|uniref:Uncharacterized protein n=1 Tax=Opisthorchis viverrini TaxID=6198 RepID=A0A075AI29_OPIVI|nr:hypothetical protein T265_02729 [Opisthorchis viverrini]KER30914.1 hypothetical protein T265_02729 [Opisthorchis viverrini]
MRQPTGPAQLTFLFLLVNSSILRADDSLNRPLTGNTTLGTGALLSDKGSVAVSSSSTYRAATAEKSTPRKIGQEFGTLAGPTPRRDPIGRKSGPNSQS